LKVDSFDFILEKYLEERILCTYQLLSRKLADLGNKTT